jgi:formate dehydrogenase (NADP+) beta subunit
MTRGGMLSVKWPIELPDRRFFERLISCREACPVHTDARGYVQAVAAGDYELAYRIARAPNPFASICGRVCGAPCESACRRGDIDSPVSIRALKRTATERHGVEALEDPAATLAMSTAPGSVQAIARSQKVAVVGAGVAGLTCAHDLARLGYPVTVFEGDDRPGGMLRYGVPTYRLPENTWTGEIEAIEALGVELRCGVKIGSDLTIPELRDEGYEAVFLGVGLQNPRMLELPGMKLAGIHGGLALLRAFNAGSEWPAMGRVLVVGGGNVAYDCARAAVRLAGTSSVTLACLESLEEMPADLVEIEEGAEEGITLLNRVGPVRFIGEEGRVTGLEVRRVTRVFDDEGRFAPEMEPGTEQTVSCDTILLAVGQVGDTGFVTGLPEIELGRGGSVVADRETGCTSIPWLFAAGDAALGPGLFINAIAHAQRTARSIHTYFVGEEAAEVDYARSEERQFAMEEVREGLVEGYTRLDRHSPPSADPRQRLAEPGMQVEEVFPDRDARLQGARCLRCEVETIFDGSKCILCGGCADVCPTFCLRLVPVEDVDLEGIAPAGTSVIIKDEERCIRCGMCAVRCPTDTITMERLCGFEPWAAAPDAGNPA